MGSAFLGGGEGWVVVQALVEFFRVFWAESVPDFFFFQGAAAGVALEAAVGDDCSEPVAAVFFDGGEALLEEFRVAGGGVLEELVVEDVPVYGFG